MPICRPLGQTVIYVNHSAEADGEPAQMPAIVARVEGPVGPAELASSYKIWLAILDARLGVTRYPSDPVPFDDNGEGPHTWHWLT